MTRRGKRSRFALEGREVLGTGVIFVVAVVVSVWASAGSSLSVRPHSLTDAPLIEMGHGRGLALGFAVLMCVFSVVNAWTSSARRSFAPSIAGLGLALAGLITGWSVLLLASALVTFATFAFPVIRDTYSSPHPAKSKRG